MPEVPDWISNALYLGGGGILAWVTFLATARRDRSSAQNQLVDQLQEELARYRVETDRRLERLERENSAYRRFVFQLIDHINVHNVTPLPWPDDIPR